MLEREKNLSTKQKALSINLDPDKYGTIVEIGAGQEVARQFFSAGAAAGTIAKTMSAYDMRVSDEIYGKVHSYVGRQRLEQMLQREYDLLVERLEDARSLDTTYFAYAATVSAKGFEGNKECHGWLGFRVQLRPGEAPNDIILHVRMLDDENRLQSEALGILGVNLIHATFEYANRPKWVIESLLDGIGQDRMEVDFIHFAGPAFNRVENRLMNLHLIRSWLTRAVMFGTDGEPIVPRETLYKRPVMVIRGSFKPLTKVHIDMVRCAKPQFIETDGVSEDRVVLLAEITMSELVSGDSVDDSDFLARVDLLNAQGATVLVSDYLRYFRLRSWLRRYTQNPIGIVISVRDFDYLFGEHFYQGLEGGILEAMGKLFSDNTCMYVYPAKVNGDLVTLEEVSVPSSQQHLLAYLLENKRLVPCRDFVEENLHISATQLVEQITRGRGGWEQGVPEAVAAEIRQRRLFGYPGD
jgi:hypothetical protein